MSYIKDRNGNNLYYKPDYDRDNKYYSCKTGAYAGRKEANGYYTNRNGDRVGYRGADGVFYDNLGRPRYKKY